MDEYLPDDWENPKWGERNVVHNWRNYISIQLRNLWDSFNDEQKKAIACNAMDVASNEHWN